MTEKVEHVPGEHLDTSLQTERQEYLGKLAREDGEDPAVHDEKQPRVLLGIADFRRNAPLRMRPVATATWAYKNLIRIAQEQQEAPDSFVAQLPKIDFKTMPTDASQRSSWADSPEKFSDLTYASLRAFVDKLDELLYLDGRHKAQNNIYDGLGKLTGPAQIEIWREMVYFSDRTDAGLNEAEEIDKIDQ